MEEKRVYLAGTVCSEEDPYKWHREIQKMDPRVEWINPFTIHDEDASEDEIYKGDINAIIHSDAILLRRNADYEICGAYIESGYAGAFNIPTIVHNEASSECPEFLRWHSDSIHSSKNKAVQKILEVLDY